MWRSVALTKREAVHAYTPGVWESPWGNTVNIIHADRLKAFWQDVEGAQAVEYVIIAAALTTAIIPGFYYVSSAVADQLSFITSFVLGG